MIKSKKKKNVLKQNQKAHDKTKTVLKQNKKLTIKQKVLKQNTKHKANNKTKF